MTEPTDAVTSGGEGLRQLRLEKAQKLRDLGASPYALRTPERITIADLKARFAEYEAPERAFVEAKAAHKADKRAGKAVGAEPTRTHELIEVGVAGRIRQHRGQGKLYFIDIVDQTGKIQLLISKKDVGDEAWAIIELTDLADFVWAKGKVGLSERGELSVFVSEFKLLTKSILPPPNIAEKTVGKESAISDAETRQRQRYLDLMMNEDSRARFQARSKIIAGIRQYLDDQAFLEVETPMMQPLFGGARARPFITNHNALKMQLYLRIAPELYLKRLLVGGFERVYEINRNFRNEGIDTQHNPEFTMLELYEAYGDYHRMMALTEGIYAAALTAIGLGDEIEFQGRKLSFKRPWPRLRYVDLFHEHVGIKWGDRPAMEAKARELGLDARVLKLGDDWLGNELWEACCEKGLDQPCFVIDYPTAISPLAKQRDDDPRWVERFEAFAFNGMELANAFSELNDPEEQRRRFEEQVAEAERTGDMEVPREVDIDYVTALSHGMPPAGGLGIGIDRMIMLLTDTTTIRDVILFPLLRSRSAEE